MERWEGEERGVEKMGVCKLEQGYVLLMLMPLTQPIHPLLAGKKRVEDNG